MLLPVLETVVLAKDVAGMDKRIVIYGNGQYARLMYRIAADERAFEIAAFTADAQFIIESSLFGLPVVAFEAVDSQYPPAEFDMMVLIGATRMRNRNQMFERAKAKGYYLPNYIGCGVTRYSDLVLGENNLIFSGVHLGPGGRLGNNNMIRPNAYIGHDFNIGSHNYIAPGCNVAGYVRIANLSYIGIGTTVIQRIVIADEVLIGAGSLVLRSTEPYSKYFGSPARKMGEHQETGIVFAESS